MGREEAKIDCPQRLPRFSLPFDARIGHASRAFGNVRAQDMLHASGFMNSGAFKNDPLLKAHGAILRLFAGLLEHENASVGCVDMEAGGPPRIPGLQDPFALIERLRACKRGYRSGDAAGEEAQIDVGARARAWDHLRRARKLLRQAATGLPDNASIACYRAAMRAAGDGHVAALRQIARFVERNPGSVKARAFHARLLDRIIQNAQHTRKRVQDGSATYNECGGEEAMVQEVESDDGMLLAEVVRARALRGWLEADPLEPRAALGLAVIYLERSAAALGVADELFVVERLLQQLETHGFPRTCAQSQGTAGARGVLYTSRAVLLLWGALADILGPLRVRDEPVPLISRSAGRAPPPSPPRPGTIWDQAYGTDPPWAPTDFQRQDGFTCGGGGQRSGRGTEGAGPEGAELGPPAPHPLVRGVDQELWEETLLDPNADPLLGGPIDTPVGAPVGEMWCRYVRTLSGLGLYSTFEC